MIISCKSEQGFTSVGFCSSNKSFQILPRTIFRIHDLDVNSKIEEIETKIVKAQHHIFRNRNKCNEIKIFGLKETEFIKIDNEGKYYI